MSCEKVAFVFLLSELCLLLWLFFDDRLICELALNLHSLMLFSVVIKASLRLIFSSVGEDSHQWANCLDLDVNALKTLLTHLCWLIQLWAWSELLIQIVRRSSSVDSDNWLSFFIFYTYLQIMIEKQFLIFSDFNDASIDNVSWRRALINSQVKKIIRMI